MKINGKQIGDETVEVLIDDISSKSEFKGMDEGLVKKELSSVLMKESVLVKYLVSDKIHKRSDKYKKIIKLVRAVLRQKYGMFIIDVSKRDKLLKKVSGPEDIETRTKLMKLHISSKERINLYPFLYQDLFSITKEPKTILDLGCGFNPIGFSFADYPVKYYASDISKQDCEFLNKYFKKIKVDASATPLDLTRLLEEEKLLDVFPQVDICFLFKLLESIETKGHKLAEKLLDTIKAKWIIVSFPKKKLSGVRMNRVERKWFEKICERKEFSYKKLDYENEFFYIVKK